MFRNLHKRILTCASLMILLAACASKDEQTSQLQAKKLCDVDYSPYQATVLGHCQIPRADLPKEIPTQKMSLMIKPADEIPEVFWYHEGFQYSVNEQPHAAPLVFLIAGTGASYQSPNMISLQKSLYKAGNHVVSVSSPTYSNFIINASTEADHLPGYLQKDAQILLTTLKAINQQLKQETEIQITEYGITGYSLGGAHAAFVSHIDDSSEKFFDFKKVLLINPPASLYSSVQILDGYLDLKNNRKQHQQMMDDIFHRLSHSYATMKTSQLSMNSIYDLFEESDISEEQLKLLIGVSFRFSSSDMLYAIDTTYNLGVLSHKNHNISKFESISHSQERAIEIGFLDYFHKGMLPYYQKTESDLTTEKMIDRLGLTAIEDYLKNSQHIALVTNADDIILAEGEIDYFKDIFSERAKIFEQGGHCGNMDREEFSAYLSNYFNAEQGVN